MNASDAFDVDRYRRAPRRRAVVRRCQRAVLVLGSTQPAAVVDQAALARAGVSVVRRRTGGGAVLLYPEDPLWVDVWVPRGDPLFDDDAARAVHWVGEWWSDSLAQLGFGPTEVQRTAAAADAISSLVCFAGLGAGEVHRAGRKVVGVAQWRSKQGALIHCAAYRRWSPEPLLDFLDWKDADRGATMRRLRDAAVGFDEPGATRTAGALTLALLDSLPEGEWDVSVETA